MVSEYGPEAAAGDYMTALDFAQALAREIPCQCFFYAKSQPVDATDIDVLVVMTDDFDPRGIVNLACNVTLIAWARNWFHRWAARPWRERFDLWFAASDLAQNYLRQALGRDVALLRLATDAERFASGRPDPALQCDVAFTGHFWGSPREVVELLEDTQGVRIRFFGKGWDTHPEGVRYWAGVLPYERMADVYASAPLVVDDSNFATASWGSLNSRIFDSLAAGSLPITNNAIGVAEAFKDLIPTYSDRQTLQAHLRHFAGDEAARLATVERARAEVLRHHTYAARARHLLAVLRTRLASGFRIAIKICCPAPERTDGWGDWYFATSLRRELEALGHTVRIDCLSDWYAPQAQADEACIALRGLDRYQPRPHQLNLLWVISHPDRISVHELASYDLSFAASRIFCEHHARFSQRPIGFLPQCTDPTIFHPAAPTDTDYYTKRGPVFVGNSRNILRPMVKAAIDEGIDVEVHGGGWEGLLPATAVRSTLVPNEKLGQLYRGAAVVLNDHWEDMRRWGVVSNRIFDALACARPVISDPVPGVEELFGKAVLDLREGQSLRALLRDVVDDAKWQAARVELAKYVIREHSFAARARVIDRALRDLAAAQPDLSRRGGSKAA